MARILLVVFDKSIGGGVGLVSALRLGHWLGCKIGEYTADRTSVVV